MRSFDIDNNTESQYDYRSFTHYHAIDIADEADTVGLGHLGRNNEFTANFEGAALNEFHHRITNLSQLWIDVIGLQDAKPGDVVEIQYLEHYPPMEYTHQGYWMVQRVVHIIGNFFITRLLLTRNGSEPGVDNTLLKARFVK
jgi:hypothetical protein